MNTENTSNDEPRHLYYELPKPIAIQTTKSYLVIHGAYIAKSSRDPVELILWDCDEITWTGKKRREIPMHAIRTNQLSSMKTCAELRELAQYLTDRYTDYGLAKPETTCLASNKKSSPPD